MDLLEELAAFEAEVAGLGEGVEGGVEDVAACGSDDTNKEEGAKETRPPPTVPRDPPAALAEKQSDDVPSVETAAAGAARRNAAVISAAPVLAAAAAPAAARASASFSSSRHQHVPPPPLPTPPPPAAFEASLMPKPRAGKPVSYGAMQRAAEHLKAARAAGVPYARPADGRKRRKKHLRAAAGEVWEDPTLGMWPENDFRIFAGNLGDEVTDETLMTAFGKYHSFAMARVVRDKQGKTKGFGFLSFLDPFDCVKAMREMNGKYVGNRPVQLRKSDVKERSLKHVRKHKPWALKK